MRSSVEVQAVQRESEYRVRPVRGALCEAWLDVRDSDQRFEALVEEAPDIRREFLPHI